MNHQLAGNDRVDQKTESIATRRPAVTARTGKAGAILQRIQADHRTNTPQSSRRPRQYFPGHPDPPPTIIIDRQDPTAKRNKIRSRTTRKPGRQQTLMTGFETAFANTETAAAKTGDIKAYK